MPREKPDPEKIAEQLSTPVPRQPVIPVTEMLSTGCALLNLAISGKPNVAVPMGGYLYLVGDSGSSKTWISYTLFAEAARNHAFTNYRFVADIPENGALMDVGHYFGADVANRLEPPRGTVNDPEYSQTAQQFFMNLESNVRVGPCIYLLDSMDALNDDSDEEKFEAELHYHETGKGESAIPGSMGMAKAKTNSRNLNRVVRELKRNGSILIVISQTRDKVGSHIPGLKTRGGGRALKFFAHLELWTTVRSAIKKTHQRKEREIGSLIRIDIQKNRVSGWEGAIEIPFLKGVGWDDTGSCIEYLIEERHWSFIKKESKRSARDDDDEPADSKRLSAPEFEFEGTIESLVKHIEDAGRERELGDIVARVWNDILVGATPVRKRRYT